MSSNDTGLPNNGIRPIKIEPGIAPPLANLAASNSSRQPHQGARQPSIALAIKKETSSAPPPAVKALTASSTLQHKARQNRMAHIVKKELEPPITIRRRPASPFNIPPSAKQIKREENGIEQEAFDEFATQTVSYRTVDPIGKAVLPILKNFEKKWALEPSYEVKVMCFESDKKKLMDMLRDYEVRVLGPGKVRQQAQFMRSSPKKFEGAQKNVEEWLGKFDKFKEEEDQWRRDHLVIKEEYPPPFQPRQPAVQVKKEIKEIEVITLE